MNKAFVKDDGEQEEEELLPPLPASGDKNYITSGGFARLRDELRHLLEVERPELVRVVAWAASNGDRSENGDYLYGKKRLREIDRRIRFLTQHLDRAEVIDPSSLHSDQVRFGATVVVRDESGRDLTYCIVGGDEIDLKRGHISWLSPLAQALWNARSGDIVSFSAPGGERELEVVELHYRAIPSG
jgi:transcription elongation factor GreB